MLKISRFLLSLIVVLGAFASVFGAEEQRITVGLTNTVGTTGIPLTIAKEKGFFKSEGLDVSLVVMQNQVVVNAVLAKNLDYGATFSNFVGAALAGLPVRVVMAVMEGADHVLVTSPEIKRVEDLRGKIIGISSFGGTPHSQVVMILRKHGMNPDKDVAFLQIGGTPSRYTALEGGAVQAVMLVPPFDKMAQKKGFRELLSFNEIVKIPLGGIAVHKDRIREKPDEIVRLIRGILKSLDFIRSHKSEMLSYLERSWGIRDLDVREGIYRDAIDLYTRNGIAPDETMRNVIQMVQDARKTKRDVPLSEIVDWTFAKRANEELGKN